MSSIHPAFIVAGVGLLLALAGLAAAFAARTHLVRVLATISVCIFIAPSVLLFLALHPAVIDPRFRTYRAFYNDVQVGMTREQVFDALERRYSAGGARQKPKILDDTSTALNFFMNPEGSREPNCEGVFLVMSGGKVISKCYSPD